MTDAYRPSTWHRYRNKSDCEECRGTCCHLPLAVSAYDLIRLKLATEEEAALSLRKLARRLKSEGVIESFSPTTGVFMIRQVKEKCPWLNARYLCDVYEKRPEVCRQFPKIGPRPGFCPRQLRPRARQGAPRA